MRRYIVTSILCAALAATGCRKAKPATVSEVDVAAPATQARLLRGFYPAIPDVRWRWTSRVFAFSLDAPPLEREVYLEFEYGLPEELVNEVGGVTLIGTVNGIEVGRETYYRAGHYVFTHYVPVRALTKTPAEVVFELDRSAALPGDGRIIGVNALAAGFKRFENTTTYRVNKTLLARQGYNATVEHLQLQLPPGKALELKQLFARLPVFDKLRFQNIPIGQNPFDLWAIQQILWEVQPNLIVATGTGEGGLPLYMAQTLDGLGLEQSRIVAVDPGTPAREAAQHFLRRKYVEFLKGEPADPAVVATIQQQAKGKNTVVLLNAGQNAERVLEQLRAYAPLVSSGGYLIVEYTETDALAGKASADKSPYDVVQQFLNEDAGRGFEADRGREMALFTRNTGGWLRKR